MVGKRSQILGTLEMGWTIHTLGYWVALDLTLMVKIWKLCLDMIQKLYGGPVESACWSRWMISSNLSRSSSTSCLLGRILSKSLLMSFFWSPHHLGCQGRLLTALWPSPSCSVTSGCGLPPSLTSLDPQLDQSPWQRRYLGMLVTWGWFGQSLESPGA